MTTQSPTWRDASASGESRGSASGGGEGPGDPGDRATPGTTIGGRYELRIPIGNGGMGTVWRATDTLLRRDVAVKEVLLPPTMPRNERDALCERTMREARAAAALSHPSVVQVFDVVTDGNRPWIVMELLDARSLADMVIDDGPLPARSVAKIGIAMLGALEVAHAAGVLHRDVKPANVLVCGDGRCVLTDFGVARLPTESKLTTPGMVLGSPHFISPERAVGGAFGPPSDLFSLGVTLYTAVEGGPPFDRGDPFETMRAVVEEAPRPPKLSGPLQPILLGLLEKEPSRRWSVEQARVALRELLSDTLSQSSHARSRADTESSARTSHAAADPTDHVAEPPAIARQAGPGRRQVGGRAMLDPDESLTGQLARLRAQSGDIAPRDIAPRDAGSSGAPTRDAAARDTAGRPAGPQAPRREGVGRRRAPSQTAIVAGQVRGRVHALSEEARRPQNRNRVLLISGLVLVIVLAAIVIATTLGGGSGSPTTGPGTTVAATTPPVSPLIPVQLYSDNRGFTVNVPKGWTKSAAGSYIDFLDPAGGRKVRINVENAAGTPEKFLQVAENGLKQKASTCAVPYQRIALRSVQLDGHDAAELEYTCGTGANTRHGLWRAIVVSGKAYHFYLTVPDTKFAASLVIYDEMVRSFHLG